jgi:hypothetical protein
MILALDPGNERSAIVSLCASGLVISSTLADNETIRQILRGGPVSGETLVIEQIESFGMPVGREVFETVFWAGRFAEAWGGAWTRVTRRDVKLHLCGSARAKDSNIRQALIDRYGGKDHAIGRKAHQGPLYGLRSDLWAALAVGVTHYDRRQQQEARPA